MNNDLVVTRIENVFMTRTAGWSMPKPICRSRNGLVYFFDGSITYHFDEEDKTATPDSLLIFPQGLRYYGNKLTNMLTYCVIDFETDRPDSLNAMSLPRILPKSTDWVREIFTECEEIWRVGAFNSQLLLKERVYALLANLLTYRKRNDAAEFLQEMVGYIHRHYTEPEFGIDKLGEHFHMSTSQIRRIFSNELDVSPLQYILNLRMKLAQNLLRYEGLSVNETAERCGFQSEAYFSRQFKLRTGMSPSSYKNSGAAE